MPRRPDVAFYDSDVAMVNSLGEAKMALFDDIEVTDRDAARRAC